MEPCSLEPAHPRESGGGGKHSALAAAGEEKHHQGWSSGRWETKNWRRSGGAGRGCSGTLHSLGPFGNGERELETQGYLMLFPDLSTHSYLIHCLLCTTHSSKPLR